MREAGTLMFSPDQDFSQYVMRALMRMRYAHEVDLLVLSTVQRAAAVMLPVEPAAVAAERLAEAAKQVSLAGRERKEPLLPEVTDRVLSGAAGSALATLI